MKTIGIKLGKPSLEEIRSTAPPAELQAIKRLYSLMPTLPFEYGLLDLLPIPRFLARLAARKLYPTGEGISGGAILKTEISR